jgi:SAM-dependent methyltransferase/polysaccharide pyruvyl transferase WcaK-like protein
MSCPVCFSTEVKTTFVDSRDNFKIEIHQCLNCGHHYQPEANYQEIYTTGEFTQEARQGSVTPDNSKIKELDRRALKRVHYYREFIDQMDHILEVGSSIGSFVHVLKLYGKEAWGLEPDPGYANYSADQYGFEQYQGLLEDFNPQQQFGGICCFHTLEHVRDPHEFLKGCSSILEASGKVLLELPSLELHMYGSMKNTIWKPHIHYFTRSSLYHLFSQYFEVEALGFYGSALYVFGIKSKQPTFKKSVFKSQKRKASQAKNLVKLFPEVPIKLANISAKQLLMQSLIFQKNRNELLKRFGQLGWFAIQNKRYLKQEQGKGSKTATHFSYFSGWENAGDTVLSKTVRDNFNVIVPTKWTLKNVTHPVDQHTIDDINRKQYMVIGGGGLLLPDSNPNSISGWQWAIPDELLQSIEVPVLVYAIGYNFFIGQHPGDLFIHSLKKIVDKASFFSLRNYGSIKAVKSLVEESLWSKIRFQPCPTTVIRNVDKTAPLKQKTKNVGINIAYDRYHLRYGADMYQILDQIALALKEISSKGYRIFNLCHLENDAKFELTLDAHNIHYQTINLQYSLPQQTYETYCNMELTLGTRGHAQMIPFGLNSKILSLGSHNKLKYFLEDIQSLDWYVDLREEVSSLKDRITTRFFEIIDSTEVDERLIYQQSQLYKATTDNYEIIKDIISG